MWKLKVFTFAGILSYTAAISPSDGHSEKAVLKRPSSDASLSQILRREQDLDKEQQVKRLELTARSSPKEASLLQQSAGGDKTKPPRMHAGMDRTQVFQDLLPGPIPESQKPIFAIFFLIMVSACLLMVHLSYQQKEELKEEEQAAMRRRMLRMQRAAAAAAAGSLMSEDTQTAAPLKGTGKGFGGKVGGMGQARPKGKAKGAKGESSESTLNMETGSWQFGAKGKSIGKNPPAESSESASDIISGISRKGESFGKGHEAELSESAADIVAGSGQLGNNGKSKSLGNVNAEPDEHSNIATDNVSRLKPHRPAPKGAAGSAGLGLGRKKAEDISDEGDLAPTSSTASPIESISNQSSDSEPTRSSRSELGASTAGKSNEKPAKASSKASAAKKKKEGSPKIQDVLAMLRSAEKIQTFWRSWKAAHKMPTDNQRITFVCDVLQGTDMPNVNRFGGCDPFLECRIVKGDPTNCSRSDIDAAPLCSAQTDVKRNDMSPSWRQRVTLPDLIYDKDLFVQLVLWDYNLGRNQAVGHAALPLERALISHAPRKPERALSFTALPGVDLELKAKVSARFSFWEQQEADLHLHPEDLPEPQAAADVSSA